MRTPILKQKLKLSAAEYYVLEKRILYAIDQEILDFDIIKRLITNTQLKYFSLRLKGYNFNRIANSLKVDGAAVTQACKRAAIFITEYLDKTVEK